MPGSLEGDYIAARIGGRLVIGIGQGPTSSPPMWSTYVRVENLEQTFTDAQQAGGGLLAGPWTRARKGVSWCSPIPSASRSAPAAPTGGSQTGSWPS